MFDVELCIKYPMIACIFTQFAQFIRPPGTVVSGGLIFCCGFFLSFLWHFAALYLRDGWADRPETYTYDWKCGHLDLGCL